jgi:hypothetical protein
MSRARVKHKRAQVFEPHSLNSLPGGGVWRRGRRMRRDGAVDGNEMCDPSNAFAL